MECRLPDHPRVVCIVGPTAVGKSRLALQLAPEFNADIISADSRQVYRYMDIGTAKPSRDEQAAVRHYMIDLVQPDESYSVQRYREEASHVLAAIGAQGRVALVVGGTGFYVRALLDGMSVPPIPPDPELRNHLRLMSEEEGPHVLHQRLAESDPASAERIHPHNVPRLIRALEIVEHSGLPVPEPEPEASIPALYIGVTSSREVLREVADRRVLSQVQAGLVEETAILLEMGYQPTAPALCGFAYREMVGHLSGKLSLDEAISLYQNATRRYIRRQFTWFRQDSRIVWLDSRDNATERARSLIHSWLDSSDA